MNTRIDSIRTRLQSSGLVEQLLAFELGVALAVKEPEDSKTIGSTTFTEYQLDRIIRVLAVLPLLQGRKIQVIKVVRELTGLGLKEAKDLVDKSYESVPMEYHSEPSISRY